MRQQPTRANIAEPPLAELEYVSHDELETSSSPIDQCVYTSETTGRDMATETIQDEKVWEISTIMSRAREKIQVKHLGLLKLEHRRAKAAVLYQISTSPQMQVVAFFEIPSKAPILSTTTAEGRRGATIDRFYGYCLDSGAARSVADTNQYKELCNELKRTRVR